MIAIIIILSYLTIVLILHVLFKEMGIMDEAEYYVIPLLWPIFLLLGIVLIYPYLILKSVNRNQ